MKIAISGGTGSFGKRLISKYQQELEEILVLTRHPEKYNSFGNIRYIGWNNMKLTGWETELEGVDSILNLAGENLAGDGFFPDRWTPSKKKKIIESRKKSGEILGEAISKLSNPPRNLIQASAVGFYGTELDHAYVETDPRGDGFLASVCQVWEDSSKSVEDYGVKHIITRIGVVLSPESGALLRMLVPYRMFVGGPFGSGNQFYSWIHIDDVIDALMFLIRTDNHNSIYNLTSPNPVRNKEFGKILGNVLGRPSWIPVPGFMMELAFGEVSSVVLEGQKVLPRNLEKDGFLFQFPMLKSALEDLL